MQKNNTMQKIQDLLQTLKIYINADGGDVEFVKYKNNILTLKIIGKCATCPFQSHTFDEGLKYALMQEIKEIKDVKFIS